MTTWAIESLVNTEEASRAAISVIKNLTFRCFISYSKLSYERRLPIRGYDDRVIRYCCLKGLLRGVRGPGFNPAQSLSIPYQSRSSGLRYGLSLSFSALFIA